MSPDDRRAAIVNATLAVMIRQGIAATTVRDVATEMGTSSGLIHHYFESMDDVIAAAFEQAALADLTAVQTGVSQAAHAVEKLERFIASYRSNDGDTTFQLWLDAWSEATRRPALQRTSWQLNSRWQQMLFGVITAGISEGTMTCQDPEAAAWRLLSILDGLALQTVAHDGALTDEQTNRWSRRAAEGELGLPVGTLNSVVSQGVPG